MMTAKEIMTTDVITLTPETDIGRAAQLLLEKGINGAPVLDEEGRVVGILCQSDLVAQQKRLPMPTVFTLLDSYVSLSSSKQIEKEVRKIAALTVAEAMTPDPVTVQSDTTLETIAGLMVDSGFHTLPVVDQGTLVGIIGKEDVLKTLLSAPKAN
ncbi:CBS domain-containing protein [Desulfatitalea tepidiphila]|uniref:CBS domain-containing protein n=1 Tax=Desulfatitalea tepidiphila TaxID=1185843 RepID=UPI0006B5A26D|nr:CBS domain-containing protein [Desulfatitalea tepidiphila]